MSKNKRFPELVAVIGNDSKLMREGKRMYFPYIIIKGDKRFPYDGTITVNEGGNHFQEDNLNGFDRMAKVLAAAPKLLAALCELRELLEDDETTEARRLRRVADAAIKAALL